MKKFQQEPWGEPWPVAQNCVKFCEVTVGPLTVVGVILLLYGIEYSLVMCSVWLCDAA